MKMPKPGKAPKARDGERPAARSYERLVEAEVAGVRDELATLAASGRPVIAGPFTSEVGFELLYWIPFLHWAVREFPSLGERLTVVSRGGTQTWYHELATDYVDLLALYSPEDYVARRTTEKQREIGAWDRDVQERVQARIGAGRSELLHPSIFFNLYYRATKIERHAFVRPLRDESDHVEGLTAVYRPLPRPDAGEIAAALPEDFVAVRFYHRASFPDSQENRQFALDVVRALSEEQTVVLLNNRIELDEHRDVWPTEHPRVVTLDHLMTPATNLHVQTIALSRAKAFVGTYGGMAYLGPFLGIPSLGFTANSEGTRSWHLDLAQRVFEHPACGTIAVLRPEHVPLAALVASPRASRDG